MLNIGAGTGSYEPRGIRVVGLEPSELMIRNRPETAAPCVMGAAESLPFKPDSFDACLGILTIHHWIDWKQGIQEALRVCRRKLILLTWDPNVSGFWLTKDYLPEIHASDSKKSPSIPDLRNKTEADLGYKLIVKEK